MGRIISREQAKASALTRYFTGDPCRRGHLSERGVAGGHCCECLAEKSRAWRAANPDKVQAINRANYADNAEARKAQQARYRQENIEAVRESDRRRYAENRDARLAWHRQHHEKVSETRAAKSRLTYQANAEVNRERARQNRKLRPEIASAGRALRRARLAMAAPAWVSEFDSFVWTEAADLVPKRRSATGIEWAADHMIPLRARTACGLHVGGNCQVIPAQLNCQKRNRMIFTEPLQWLQKIC